MNLIFTGIIIFVITFLLLSWFAKANSKKIAKSVRNLLIISSFLIAIILLIGACNYGIFNDTGFAHIASGLGLKCLVLFMDSPPAAYGVYSKNISIIVPEGETIESCRHNTRGKDKISFQKVLVKSLELVN